MKLEAAFGLALKTTDTTDSTLASLVLDVKREQLYYKSLTLKPLKANMKHISERKTTDTTTTGAGSHHTSDDTDDSDIGGHECLSPRSSLMQLHEIALRALEL